MTYSLFYSLLFVFLVPNKSISVRFVGTSYVLSWERQLLTRRNELVCYGNELVGLGNELLSRGNEICMYCERAINSSERIYNAWEPGTKFWKGFI